MNSVTTLIVILISSLVSAPNLADTKAVYPEKLAHLALECVHKEYPNKISHTMQSDIDLKPPRELTPSFYGCFDWHSSVHGHWLLVRLAKLYPEKDLSVQSIEILNQSFAKENLLIEKDYFQGTGRTAFERPYGLAWLLQLVAELEEWDDNQTAIQWRENIKPLENIVMERIVSWLPKLTYPVRSGQHSQTAFALGLFYDWAIITNNIKVSELIKNRSLNFYYDDKNCPLNYEPSGSDFLSPCLAEADLMRRILAPNEFAQWLGDFLEIPSEKNTVWIEPAIVSDRSDPKLAHLDGLNLSRAWMLEGIATGLPMDDPRKDILINSALQHANIALDAVTGEFYEGGHWLGSFATYLVTQRGL
ncbi:MAG TPA: DUF2891 domain-containing protein [Gammaproteobacteria bacterium]|nr:DUF2891 domain-containing protein [Gammaproteobacteria bacterium]HIK77000.1 DUF2891 domain-containing protein [Gammaproteobacteria bacterium]